jgi:PAS domain S-box-containing protein
MTAPNVETLLIVDDEVHFLNVLVEALSSQGYKVVGVSSGGEALAAIESSRFDLLLVDLVLPDIDGLSLLERALDIDPELIGVIVTGRGTIQTAVKAMKAGAFDYILKPFKLESLLYVVSRALHVRRLRQENLELRQTVAIHELSQTIAQTLDLDAILNKAADTVLQQCEADEVSILLLTPEKDALYIAAVRGKENRKLVGQRVPIDQTISGWVSRNRQPLILDGRVNDPRFSPLSPRPDIASAISHPMIVGGKLVGVINVNATRRRRSFTASELKTLSILSGTASAALESARLYEAVRQAEEKYRSIFQNAVEGIYQTAVDGRLLVANPALADILGYESPEELIASIADIGRQVYLEQERYAERGRLLEAFEILSGFESQVYRKDRRVIWVVENARTIRDANGKLVGYEGSLQDITATVEAREELQRVITAAQCLLWHAVVEEKEGQLHWDLYMVNEESAQKFLPLDVAAGETYAAAWYRSKSPEDQVTMNETARQAILGGQAGYSQEFRCINRNREIRWLSEDVFIKPFPRLRSGQAENRRWQLVGVCTDITRRKEAEENLKEYSRSLEEKIRERTAALESANRAKSEFLANMSHELRTPLNAVIGFAEVLLEKYFGSLTEKQEEYVADILESGEHLLSLINDILDLSKIEAGKMEFESEEFRLDETLKHSLLLIKEKAYNHAITLETDIDPNIGLIVGDKRKIKQTLYNLLSNAAKFTPDGGAIRLIADYVDNRDDRRTPVDQTRPDSRNWVRISVEDTGIGVPPGDLEAIFETFYQVKGARDNTIPGTGLGLSLCKRFVEMHGGSIWAESEGLGKGSRLSFTLPIQPLSSSE